MTSLMAATIFLSLSCVLLVATGFVCAESLFSISLGYPGFSKWTVWNRSLYYVSLVQVVTWIECAL